MVLLSDDEAVIGKFDSVCEGHKLSPGQMSNVAYVLDSKLPGFSVGVFLPIANRNVTQERVLAKQLQALEPIKGGRIGMPSIDGYMASFISDGDTRNSKGVQRPVELMRHVIRSVRIAMYCFLIMGLLIFNRHRGVI
jgi:hypothetical protein